MHGVRLVISDDHHGLEAARKTVLGSVPWQRCQFSPAAERGRVCAPPIHAR
ncbi:transposase [Anaerolinea thermophila]|uniref:transposase n=1 Tax=Anaerolinea thermophila TaxID=167964 RepID=UPI00343081EF